MSEKERLQLENELLMTCSKAQAINKYIDELEESSKLSELWCKSQERVKNLEDKLNTQRKYYQNRLMKIQEENIQLKTDLEMYENGVYFSSENDKLQQRIDKSIEYIKRNSPNMSNSELYDLLEILNGGENNK